VTPPDTAGSAGLEVADVLERAAELLTPEGAWAQHIWYFNTERTCFCMIGAVAAVDGKAPSIVECELRDLFASVIGVERTPSAWNDDPERTQQEVVDALKAAAALSRAGKSS
jgi:hypothetical protein